MLIIMEKKPASVIAIQDTAPRMTSGEEVTSPVSLDVVEPTRFINMEGGTAPCPGCGMEISNSQAYTFARCEHSH